MNDGEATATRDATRIDAGSARCDMRRAGALDTSAPVGGGTRSQSSADIAVTAVGADSGDTARVDAATAIASDHFVASPDVVPRADGIASRPRPRLTVRIIGAIRVIGVIAVIGVATPTVAVSRASDQPSASDPARSGASSRADA